MSDEQFDLGPEEQTKRRDRGKARREIREYRRKCIFLVVLLLAITGTAVIYHGVSVFFPGLVPDTPSIFYKD